MKMLKVIWDEFIGLFVDDERFAVAIVVWIGLAWLAVAQLALQPAVAAVGLALGFVAILVESAWRRARK